MNVNQWGAVNQWSATAEPLVINASLGASTTQGFNAIISINGQSVTVNAQLGAVSISGFNASVTITPAPSEPVIINAAIVSAYSAGYSANVTIGTVTINIYPSTHYEIPNYY